MALIHYSYTPILVDLGDHPQANVKLRARRVDVSLPDSGEQPCTMLVELIPYQRLEDGSYGPELTNSVFTRKTCRPLTVSKWRLVEAQTGRILVSRFGEAGMLRPDADYQADVDRIAADETILAMSQADWFNKLMAEGLPEPINLFIEQYIQLAWLSGDLV